MRIYRHYSRMFVSACRRVLLLEFLVNVDAFHIEDAARLGDHHRLRFNPAISRLYARLRAQVKSPKSRSPHACVVCSSGSMPFCVNKRLGLLLKLSHKTVAGIGFVLGIGFGFATPMLQCLRGHLISSLVS